jgi:glycogen phosphorylase
MRALRSFAVRASLPPPLEVVVSIAMNLRWSWDPRAVELFRWIDADAWDRAGHDPVRMLGLVPRARLEQLVEDGPFMAFLASVDEDLRRYMSEPRWFGARTEETALGEVAYFSPEFGVSEALPTYSGGLGVLAGDHLKAASDLGVPMVGIGLLYRQGYFRQSLNADGWQQEHYPSLDPHAMPLTLLSGSDGAPLRVDVDLAGARCLAQIWRAQIGRVPLLLLDCDIEGNEPEERNVTDRLYAGGTEHRLRQEIVLGIGGMRALDAAGFRPDVFHSNEGHAGFMGLERIRRLVTDASMSFDEALEAVRATGVFTTHTPVPAGIDIYEVDLMDRYFATFAKECGVSFEGLMRLGQAETPPEGGPGHSFNMAVMGFRLAGRANGVSELHGAVSRSLFSALWPSVPVEEVPISHVTNGVHAPTWLGPEMTEVLSRRLAPGWTEGSHARWDRIAEVPDAELWRARERARERLVYFLRDRMRRQLAARGASETELARTEEVLDPGVLTIGFARRFAQYKRATLMLADPDRLKRLLLSSDRAIQFVLAGKAHPRDDGGKELIRQLVHFAGDPDVWGRFVFVEDYDMEVGRLLTQGVDVWLNNPRRPLEACGTSGMKAALNGALNFSILDGWWNECYDGHNGWTIGGTDVVDEPAAQDRVDAGALYNLLEREIVPRFYDRSEGPVPRRWVARMKHSIATLGGFVAAERMLRDYVTGLYEPAARSGTRLGADGYAGARSLAAWKSTMRRGWGDVAVVDVEGDATAARVGDRRSVTVRLRTGRLSPSDLGVELAHGIVGPSGALVDPALVDMAFDGEQEGVSTFRGSFDARAAGLYGYAVRVMPRHPELPTPMDLGLITWA